MRHVSESGAIHLQEDSAMPTYCLIFRGLVPEQAPESFALALSELHALPSQQIAVVLSGRGLILARGLSRKRALELQGIMLKNGCICALEEDRTDLVERAASEADRRSKLMQYGVALFLLILVLALAFGAFGVVRV